MNFTIKTDTETEELIKKSRFICQLKRISSEEEAQDFISEIKKSHSKANHHCSAYTLGDQQEIQRYNDDGEPSGTAGTPMLQILQKRQIINVCAVVTRYFGGIKLGTGGLIRAYSGSVNRAVNAAGLVTFVEQQELILTFAYSFFDSLERFLNAHHLKLSESTFLTTVTIHLFVNLADVNSFLTELSETFSGKIQTELGLKQIIEQEISEK